jgi:hypothetical protein
MSIPDFTNPSPIATATLTTGTLDTMATMGALGSANGVAEEISIGLTVLSGTMTDFKAQCRYDPSQPWQDYLDGADWISSTNGVQRSWSSADPTAMSSVGNGCILQMFTLGIPYWQFLGSGSAGSTIAIGIRPVKTSTKN